MAKKDKEQKGTPQLDKCVLLNDSILVKMLSDNTSETKSGIILPNARKEKAQVVKTGPGVYTEQGEQIPMQVEKGDIVMFQSTIVDKFEDIRLDGIDYKRTTETKISLILEKS